MQIHAYHPPTVVGLRLGIPSRRGRRTRPSEVEVCSKRVGLARFGELADPN
jgi:hypothetical protein